MGTFDELHPRGQAQNAGQFRAKENAAPTATLTAGDAAPARSSYQQFLDAKRDALLARGFVPATPGRATSGSPRDRGGIDNWWRDAHVRSELRIDGKSYHQMPDDFAVAGGSGRSLTGRRRTYRKLYQSGEIALRMPSAAAINRFADTIDGETFDVPVTAEGTAGNVVAGHVRLTRTGPGRWAATAINMPAGAQAKVAEAVASVLESRRPSRALADIEASGGLVVAHRARQASAGAKLVQTEQSGWIESAGYNDATGEIVLNLQGRHYGYEVPRGVYEGVVSSASPGKAYNALIKGRYPSHTVEQCTTCSRWARDLSTHRCVTHRAPTGTVKPHNDHILARLMADIEAPVRA